MPATRSGLSSTKPTATKVKPFACPWPDCSKQYTRKYGLERHHILHTGQKPLTCPTCSQAFSNLERLAYHCKTDHGFNPGPICLKTDLHAGLDSLTGAELVALAALLELSEERPSSQ
ncbi:hypothetical protein CC1G_15299 [Coprinopsis cinerea okayama7|uniref:C2H2-type domain-containing protein n=1 Tax=Coprinopsis cinerea (strain Okayama-7 / 130 / ATCC MYA-4618 / FGSC 9003) TaxID=240176 RepID=D6RPX8_COPC7|nr:hypothetical protein CC1G_15299 [Coprinopsis cinerea okayama7\|eukprot:XP_002910392.1 hypothetical protein CC1G_15299 [Coprinopsis cinerea okayama7\